MTDDNNSPPDPARTEAPRTRLWALVWAAASALAVVLLIAVTLVTRSDDERPISAVTADRPDTAATSTTAAPATAPPESTTTTTSTPPRTTTTISGTTTTESIPSCATSGISLKVETDKAIYAIGETVVITMSATNVSGRKCPPYGGGPNLRIIGPDGTLASNAPGYTIDYGPGAYWPEGETRREEPVLWDQRCDAGPCKGVQQPPGEYTIEAVWDIGGYGSTRTSIHLG
jgi:hypothetical protein